MSTKKQRLNFVSNYAHYAIEVNAATGIPYVAILTMAAIESGWGAKTVGNNCFGIMATKSYPKKTYVKTFEDFKTSKKLSEFEYYKPIEDLGNGFYRHYVYRYLRAYDTLSDCFTDWVNVLKTTKIGSKLRYEKAFAAETLNDPVKFLHAVLDAGYATGSEYKKLVMDVEKMIVNYVNELNLEVTING